MKEAPILKAILQALELRGVCAWRANAGLTVIGKGTSRRVIRGAPPGTPDVIGILKGGRFFGLEVKSPTGRANRAQLAWQRRANELGARYEVVRDVRSALAAVERWQALEAK